MQLQIRKDFGDSTLPTKANPSDVGWDVYAHSMKVVGKKLLDNGNDMDSIWEEIDWIEYSIGLSINPIPTTNISGSYEEFFTYLAPRSSIRKYNLLMCNGFGVIDRCFRNTTSACFAYKTQPVDLRLVNFHTNVDNPDGERVGQYFGIKINPEKIYKAGDKIAQLIVTTQPDVYLGQKFGAWGETDRGTNGYGSSGR